MSAWAGIAALEGDRTARESLQLAEAALQAAAERGHDDVVVLDDVSVTSSAQRARLTGEVARAVERGELEVVFQPDVTLADGRLTGIEALVRWRRPRGFAAATDTFVQLAEEVGAVQAVDAWVMEESLRALCRWRGQPGGDELELGLNVSALSLTPRLPDDLADCCARNGVPPGRVRIEVTETALADEHLARTVLAGVRNHGFRVALDDFGTGYATLARLNQMPVDVLKLDRSFLPSITDDEQARALVSLVLGLAELLGMDVVAEGVESQEQRDVLVALGCRRAQGYFFSPRRARRRSPECSRRVGCSARRTTRGCRSETGPRQAGVPSTRSSSSCDNRSQGPSPAGGAGRGRPGPRGRRHPHRRRRGRARPGRAAPSRGSTPPWRRPPRGRRRARAPTEVRHGPEVPELGPDQRT